MAEAPRHARRAPWDEVVQHVPVELAERARAAATDAGADILVCLGGGSSTGLAKAIALTHGLPILAVPTTYAGSEQTPIFGLTGARHKQTGRDLRVVPKVVIYDPALTVGLPPQVTGPSAFNALAHCVEALYATGRNPVTSAMALEGVRAIRQSLPARDGCAGRPRRTRRRPLRRVPGGRRLGTTSTGLHHKLCHVLGGTFNLVHADTALDDPAPRRRVQRSRAAGRDGAPRRGVGRAPGDAAGALHDLAVASHVPDRACLRSG